MSLCVCAWVWVNTLFLLRHAYFTRAFELWVIWGYTDTHTHSKQNKTKQNSRCTHTHTRTNCWNVLIFRKYCLIWKVLRRSSATNFTYVFSQHTISRSINLRARVLSVSMASTSLNLSQSGAKYFFLYIIYSAGGRGELLHCLCLVFFIILLSNCSCCTMHVVYQLPNYILDSHTRYIHICSLRKSQKRCAHSAQSQSCRNTKHNTQFYMQLLYCSIKSTKTRQKNTHSDTASEQQEQQQQQRRHRQRSSSNADEALLSLWRALAHTHTHKHSQWVQKYEQQALSALTLSRSLSQPGKTFVYRLTCVIGICVITIAFAPCVRRGRISNCELLLLLLLHSNNNEIWRRHR